MGVRSRIVAEPRPLHPMMAENPSAALVGLLTARHLVLLARVETLAGQLRGKSRRRVDRREVLAALEAIAMEART